LSKRILEGSLSNHRACGRGPETGARTVEKRKWRPPELVVLVRHRAEEGVLAGCKVWPNPGSIQNTVTTMCGTPVCAPCTDYSGGAS